MKVHLLVLNYNGKDLLERFLPSVVKAAQESVNECGVIVVDNMSVDGSPDYVKEKFPSIEVFSARENKVLCSFNEVLKTLDSEVVILLNNDIEVKEDFIDYLAEHFRDKDVFYVAPRLLNFDGTYNGGRSYLRFKLGILKNDVDKKNALLPGTTHSIATGAFRREEFLQLGGFSDLYLPGIWEDVDICYKGLRKGRKGLYEPRSIIWHAESTTFNRVYGIRRKTIIAHRNMFLFFWVNIRDPKLIMVHLFFLPALILYSIFTGKPELAEGFFRALPKLPEAASRRRSFKKEARLLKDRDIIR